MEELTVKGIILATAPQGEYGRRISLLTDRLGRITVFASGAARSGSHIIGSTRPLTCAEFDLAKGRSAWNLHSVRVIESFGELPLDIDVSFYAAYVLELGEFFSEAGMPEEESRALLNLMYVTLFALKQKVLSPALIRRILELRLLKLQGEYTMTPPGTSDPDADKLWKYVLTSSLTGLYDPERIPVPSDTEASETFMNSAEILFTRQISHHFRASDILHEL